MSARPHLAEKPSLSLTRRINAPPAKVFAAWTDPQKIKRWWGPEATDETLLAETDVRVGGRFRIVFRMASGEEHDVRGVYREVAPNEKLVFTWSWRTMPERESLVRIELQPDGAGTLLTLTHEQFFDEAARDSHRQGWTGALQKLARLFAAGGA
jgi:uncharacterized protein YndB with AHSA1/START domain